MGRRPADGIDAHRAVVLNLRLAGCIADWNCSEPASMPFSTKVPLLLGSEKFGKPWVRMHEAIFVSAASCAAVGAGCTPPLGSRDWQAWLAALYVGLSGSRSLPCPLLC